MFPLFLLANSLGKGMRHRCSLLPSVGCRLESSDKAYLLCVLPYEIKSKAPAQGGAFWILFLKLVS